MTGQDVPMEHRTLGRSGCAVSTLALGTMTFGAETDEAGAHAQLDAFVAAGGDLVALDDAGRAGKILYVGLPNYAGWQIQKAVDLCEFRGWATPVTLQPQYNLLAREIEWEGIPACASTGLGLLPW